MPLLEASGVKKIFGKLTALDGAALTVGENEFHGLIGPNGSGKSTLMKCIAGAEVPTQGKVSFVNADITAFTPTERARAGMSLKFQITSVLPTLTLYDNILLALQAQSSLFDLVFSRTRGLLHDQVMTMADAISPRQPRFRRGGGAVARPAAMAGDRDGAGLQAEASAAGRADRRHEPGGAPRHR
ncbi:ABC-type branched-subunit amino acid transport system ATPase component [Bradyrhizobium sp. GM2.4]